MKPIIDPRRGDLEDDASSPKRRSLLSLAGSLVSEITFSPPIASAWVRKISGKIASPYAGIGPLFVLGLLLAIGAFAGRPLLRIVERSFWALNSLLLEPCYAVSREGLQQLADQLLPAKAGKTRRSRVRAVTAAVAGVIVCALALLALILAWPSSRWVGNPSDLISPHLLVPAVLANSVVLIAIYLAVSALVWAFADATMSQPRDYHAFEAGFQAGRKWRGGPFFHLHVGGERYGFRIESGRSGPRGNARLNRLLSQLEALHATDPLDAILITGDMTDAGRSAEWAEFLDALAKHPRLAERVVMLPGNHDLNIAYRANPARLDLPTSPSKRLRQMRALSAMAELQGTRVRVVDQAMGRVGAKLADMMEPYRAQMAEFANAGALTLSLALADLWAKVFPMIMPPDPDDGLGIILLNSNAETHFSFTNALGMISAEQIKGIEIVTAQYPRACWLVALHHHPVEYPRTANALSVRIGTTLINGSWFVRRLRPLAAHVMLMHGHRHIEWVGECAGLVIIAAPSPVMDATDDLPSYFYIQTFALAPHGRLRLLAPQRITIAGEARGDE